jgi:hypothetical protein
MRALATVLALGALGAAETMTDRELLREVADTTLSGFHTGGVNFTEYHSPDGRILGYNNGEPVQDGCWRIRDNAVCYYYPKGSIRGDFCWRMERAGPDGYRIFSVETSAQGVARSERGNPRGLSDNGMPWTCDALISRRHEPLDRSRPPRLGLARVPPLP